MAKKARKPVRKVKAKRPVKKPVRRATTKRSTAKPASKATRTTKAAANKPAKQSVTIRLDTDVVAWFKKKADKYQTEINSVLRKHMSRG